MLGFITLVVVIAAFVGGHMTYVRQERVRKFVENLAGFVVVHGGFLVALMAGFLCFAYGSALCPVALAIAAYLGAISWNAGAFEQVPMH
jgi:hypothetical protein